MVKMKFSLDEATADTLRKMARRLRRSQSYVLREAIFQYRPHFGRLSQLERQRRVALFDRMLAAIPGRPAEEVDAELRQLRVSRRRFTTHRGV